MSLIFTHAAEQWGYMHSDYLDHVETEYAKAIEECAGVLVNTAGKTKKIDGQSLFTGQLSRAKKYASEELLAYWTKHPRVTLTQYETYWVTGQLTYQVAA